MPSSSTKIARLCAPASAAGARTEAGVFAEPIGRAGKRHRGVQRRIVDGAEIAVGAQLLVRDHVGDRIHRRNRDLARLALAVKLLLAARGAESAEDRLKAVDAFCALAVFEILPALLQQFLAARRAALGDPLASAS